MKDFLMEVWAVSLRDLKKKRSFLKYFVGILFLVIALLFVGIGFDTFIDFSKYGVSYAEFLSSGMLVYLIAIGGLQMGIELILDRKGFIKQLLVTPISRYSLLFGKIFSGFIGSIKGFFVVIIILLFFFNKFSFIRILGIFFFIFIITITYYGFGLWLSAMFTNRESLRTFIGYFSIALLFLSGVFIPIQALPKTIQIVFYLSPLTYTVDLFRYLMLGEHYFPILLNVTVLGVFGLISVLLGTYLFDRNLRK